MNSLRPSIMLGDTFFGTWIYVDEEGNPIVINDELIFKSSIKINDKKYPVELTVLDQTQNIGEIAFIVQTSDWSRGIAEMDLKVMLGEFIKHSEKYCFNVVGSITE